MRILLAVLGVVLFGYQAAVMQHVFDQLWRPENQTSLGFRVGAPWPTVVAVEEGTGLVAGDRLTVVGGEPFAGTAQLDRAMATRFPGDQMTVTVSRGGESREVSWRLARTEPGEVSWTRWVYVGVVAGAMPLLCLVVGFWTVWMRPRDGGAWLLLGMMASFAHALDLGEYTSSSMAMRVVHSFLALAWPLGMASFAWFFPVTLPLERRAPWLKSVFFGPMLVLVGALATIPYLGYAESMGRSAILDWLFGMLRLRMPVQMATVSLFFFVLGWKAGVVKDPDQRRRIRTILQGCGAALAPLLVVLLAQILFRVQSELGLAIGIVMMAGFPMTLAYVVLVQRAFGVGVVIRQGLQYALAQRGMRLVQIAISIAIVLTVLKLVEDPKNNRPKIITLVAGGVTAVLLLQRGATWAKGAIDRRFFREAYDSEQLLAGLGDDVRKIVETKLLVETVGRRVGAALHVEKLVIVLKEGGFAPVYPTAGAAVPAGLVAALDKAGAPLSVYWEERGSWLYREPVGELDREWLKACESELLLPLHGQERLLGFAALGTKRSEEPYSTNDIRLLKSVTMQTGLALDNARLTASVANEVAQRMMMSRELEIAREVQERLFPQKLPPVAGLEYAGYCRPARGVGGDYYDFLPLADGRFGIAIGDVSGKGIPAALLMASLQASLRGQTMAGNRDLASLMSNLNQLIFDLSPSNRYATFFYGEFDPATKELNFVNGGHNPPMILRGEEWIHLEAGGPVVGLFGPAVYEQSQITLMEGDLLIGFTDGISEAMNSADEEWGEDELAKWVKERREMGVGELIPEIMKGADAFAAGFPQHDDMTLVVARVTG